jgi:hypothetical protein
MAAQAVLINLEAQASGTVISDQFAIRGVVFRGLQPVVATVPADQLPKGTRVLDISNCPACEFPVADRVGQLSRTVTTVTVTVGMFADQPGSITAPAELTVIAFDAAHAVFSTSDPVAVVPGGGFGASLAVHDAGGTIAAFEITARQAFDGDERVGIASVAFTTPAAAAPDFALTLAQAVLVLAPSETVTDIVSIEPFNGANGNATLSVQGLPIGTTASFSPNPGADGSRRGGARPSSTNLEQRLRHQSNLQSTCSLTCVRPRIAQSIAEQIFGPGETSASTRRDACWRSVSRRPNKRTGGSTATSASRGGAPLPTPPSIGPAAVALNVCQRERAAPLRAPDPPVGDVLGAVAWVFLG